MARRSSYSLLVWLVVLVLVGGGYFFTRPKRSKEPHIRLLSWDTDDVVFVARWHNQTNTREYTAFERYGEEWYMVSPVREKVHPELFHRMLDTLSRVKTEQAFVIREASEWENYGFSPYVYRFVLSNRRGEEYTLDIGNVTPGQNYFYLRINGTETNYQTATYNLVDVTQPQGAYRWPDIFDIPFDHLEKVVFFFEGKRVVEIVTNLSGWAMVFPEKRMLTNFSVKSVLLDFYPFQIDHFLTTEVTPSFLRQYSLVTPRYGVVFVGEGRSNTLWVSDKGEEGFLYAYSGERQGIFVVSEGEVTTKWITQASQFRR
ncbi:DUF4340 domain-containing protein [Thermospira aquatica]|uniref:DUF4340 domain-containing protein n=1 Tax=Thermospira aquatica TaxID=2828656 RepID=A0AAX3BEF3_9SPIR|nr:DUF4340 domain-containing protein [Thermospira aquatica]URA10495.1 DUF4340 domain-containing protein [Thermospira aquatica]